MNVKVCGITSIDQLQQLQQIGADYAGLIFYEESKRYAGDKIENHLDELKQIPINKIGVFVNADSAKILQVADEFDLFAVQLHGDETPDYCASLSAQLKIIKAFRINAQSKIDEMVCSYLPYVDYFLFDTASEERNNQTLYGGTGQQFDWKVIRDAKIGKPFFLSGGIGIHDIQKIKEFHHPYLHSIDINSKFETEHGVKDMQLVKQFIEAIKSLTNCEV